MLVKYWETVKRQGIVGGGLAFTPMLRAFYSSGTIWYFACVRSIFYSLFYTDVSLFGGFLINEVDMYVLFDTHKYPRNSNNRFLTGSRHYRPYSALLFIFGTTAAYHDPVSTLAFRVSN